MLLHFLHDSIPKHAPKGPFKGLTSQESSHKHRVSGWPEPRPQNWWWASDGFKKLVCTTIVEAELVADVKKLANEVYNQPLRL